MALLIGLAKLAFLAILWIFIGMIARVIKRDVFGGDERTKAVTASSHSGATGQQNPKRRGHRVRQAQLLVVDGPGRGDAVSLRGDVFVGRSPDSTLDIEDDYASGKHARFYRDIDSWIVTDLGSTNGTVVNGLRITRPTRVGDGDIVRVGRTSIRVEEP